MATSTQHGWRVISERAWVFEYVFAKHGTANCFAFRLANGGVVVLSPACGMSEGAYSDRALLADAEAHPPAVVVPAHGAPLGDGAHGVRTAAVSGASASEVAQRTLSLLRGALA